MLKAAADMLITTRQRMHETLKDLSEEQWFAQPDGFANNIAWNVGHLVLAQQGLIYRRLGVEGHLPDGLAEMYRPGTSPADWTSQPDTDELLKLFVELPQKMAKDIDAGKFDNYVKPESQGDNPFPPPESAAHAMIGNQFHEGIHTGNINDLLGIINRDND
ncbi:MAG: DinB family protein [Chloroflexota bacterium]